MAEIGNNRGGFENPSHDVHQVPVRKREFFHDFLLWFGDECQLTPASLRKKLFYFDNFTYRGVCQGQ